MPGRGKRVGSNVSKLTWLLTAWVLSTVATGRFSGSIAIALNNYGKAGRLGRSRDKVPPDGPHTRPKVMWSAFAINLALLGAISL